MLCCQGWDGNGHQPIITQPIANHVSDSAQILYFKTPESFFLAQLLGTIHRARIEINMEAKILLTLTFLVGSLFSHPLPSAQLQGSGPSAAIFTSRATGAVGSSYGIQPSLTSKGFTFPSSSLNSVSKPSCPTTRYWNRRFRRYQSYKRCQSWCQC